MLTNRLPEEAELPSCPLQTECVGGARGESQARTPEQVRGWLCFGAGGPHGPAHHRALREAGPRVPGRQGGGHPGPAPPRSQASPASPSRPAPPGSHLGSRGQKKNRTMAPKSSGAWTLGRGRTGSQGHRATQEGHVPDWLVTGGGGGGREPAKGQELSRPGWGLQPPRGFRQLIQAAVLAGSDAQAMGEPREPSRPTKDPQTPDTGARTSQGPGRRPQPHPPAETHPKRSQV